MGWSGFDAEGKTLLGAGWITSYFSSEVGLAVALPRAGFAGGGHR